MILDKICKVFVDSNINLIVPWYLMSSYMYYIQFDPIISDAMYDELAVKFLKNYDTIKHRHKKLVTYGDLRAGSLLLAKYPTVIVREAIALANMTERHAEEYLELALKITSQKWQQQELPP